MDEDALRIAEDVLTNPSWAGEVCERGSCLAPTTHLLARELVELADSEYPLCHTTEDGQTFPALCQRPACRRIAALEDLLGVLEPIVAALALYGEDVNLASLVAKARSAASPESGGASGAAPPPD